jgi:hypothetical protein
VVEAAVKAWLGSGGGDCRGPRWRAMTAGQWARSTVVVDFLSFYSFPKLFVESGIVCMTELCREPGLRLTTKGHFTG